MSEFDKDLTDALYKALKKLNKEKSYQETLDYFKSEWLFTKSDVLLAHQDENIWLNLKIPARLKIELVNLLNESDADIMDNGFPDNIEDPLRTEDCTEIENVGLKINNWVKCFSPDHGYYYFYNTKTFESQWECPDENLAYEVYGSWDDPECNEYQGEEFGYGETIIPEGKNSNQYDAPKFNRPKISGSNKENAQSQNHQLIDPVNETNETNSVDNLLYDSDNYVDSDSSSESSLSSNGSKYYIITDKASGKGLRAESYKISSPLNHDFSFSDVYSGSNRKKESENVFIPPSAPPLNNDRLPSNSKEMNNTEDINLSPPTVYNYYYYSSNRLSENTSQDSSSKIPTDSNYNEKRLDEINDNFSSNYINLDDKATPTTSPSYHKTKKPDTGPLFESDANAQKYFNTPPIADLVDLSSNVTSVNIINNQPDENSFESENLMDIAFGEGGDVHFASPLPVQEKKSKKKNKGLNKLFKKINPFAKSKSVPSPPNNPPNKIVSKKKFAPHNEISTNSSKNTGKDKLLTHREKVDKLVHMGYFERDVILALDICGDNIEEATSVLLDGNEKKN